MARTMGIDRRLAFKVLDWASGAFRLSESTLQHFVLNIRTSRLMYERANHPPMRRRFAASFLPKPVLWISAAYICSLLVIGCSGGDEFRGAPAPRRVGSISVTASVTSLDCPVITSYTMTPYKNAAGSDVALTSTTSASYGVRPVFLWSATSGTFVNADRAEATYRCGVEAAPTLTLTVTYGSCVDSILIEELDCT